MNKNEKVQTLLKGRMYTPPTMTTKYDSNQNTTSMLKIDKIDPEFYIDHLKPEDMKRVNEENIFRQKNHGNKKNEESKSDFALSAGKRM